MTDTERQSAASDPTTTGAAGAAADPAASGRPTPLQVARIAARTGDERKAADIRVLDVTANSSITDYFVIMTGFNRRQIQSIAWELDRELKHHGVKKLGMEGYETAWWVLIDYGSVVVHVFHADAREYYDLDMLQGDATQIDWMSDDIPASDGTGEGDGEAPHGDGPVTADYEKVEKPETARDSGITAEDLAGIDIDSLTPIEDDDDEPHDEPHDDDDPGDGDDDDRS